MDATKRQIKEGDWIRWSDENNEERIQAVVRVENGQIYTKETGKFWLTRNDIQEVRAVNTFDQARETLRAIIHAAGSRDGVGAKEIFQAREALAAMEATSCQPDK